MLKGYGDQNMYIYLRCPLIELFLKKSNLFNRANIEGSEKDNFLR